MNDDELVKLEEEYEQCLTFWSIHVSTQKGIDALRRAGQIRRNMNDTGEYLRFDGLRQIRNPSPR